MHKKLKYCENKEKFIHSLQILKEDYLDNMTNLPIETYDTESLKLNTQVILEIIGKAVLDYLFKIS